MAAAQQNSTIHNKSSSASAAHIWYWPDQKYYFCCLPKLSPSLLNTWIEPRHLTSSWNCLGKFHFKGGLFVKSIRQSKWEIHSSTLMALTVGKEGLKRVRMECQGLLCSSHLFSSGCELLLLLVASRAWTNIYWVPHRGQHCLTPHPENRLFHP